jgi:hypothetical protein
MTDVNTIMNDFIRRSLRTSQQTGAEGEQSGTQKEKLPRGNAGSGTGLPIPTPQTNDEAMNRFIRKITGFSR